MTTAGASVRSARNRGGVGPGRGGQRIAAAWLLGHVAIEYLRTRMVDVFSRIRYGRTFHERTSDGLLEWIAQATLKGEIKMQAAKQKARDDKLARAGQPARRSAVKVVAAA